MRILDTKDVLRVFANELNDRMESKGVEARQLTLAIRTSYINVYSYRTGKSFPDLYTLFLIAERLECTVDELLGYRSNIRRRPEIKGYRSEEEFADYVRLRLVEHMKLRSVDPKELAKRTGISSSTIDMYLSVHRWVPRVPELLRICDALDCTPSELLGY